MYEGILRYIMQYHKLFPNLVEIDYHPCYGDDVQDAHTILSIPIMFDPPLIPFDVSRSILLTCGPEPGFGFDFEQTSSIVWNLSPPSDTVC